ncbi:S1C family serine protease [Gracilibacillus kekensis]|uniref:Trypsin-like peptidase domain-containing protein n=1 Tax=Gracilibacillus kekensis TaxID=1027249 RepID=A0A1M7MFC9_9BACI|nr:trypsin-like peptidase domain-containing protein [Gracilibacillus kekensis]SHM89074.1 Trypsin-like peptidase domain-containing protein [Gracilibacillus kekensis]
MYKKRKFIPVFISILILLTALIIAFFHVHDWRSQPYLLDNTLATNIENSKNEINLKNIIHESQKSVVQIETTNKLNNKTGSGFVINNEGDIITNAHVIEDAESIVVKLSNGRQYPAAIVGIGKEQDFAVIRVPELHNLEPITIDSEYQAEIGDEIIAIGSPVGIQNSVSLGLVVGTDRSFTINNFQYDNVFQISANITYGNSGGPLILRNSGKVIGINSAGISDTDIGFSIPVTQAKDQVEKWIKNANNKELEYLPVVGQQINQQQLEEDALYLVDYLFDNISLRDYVNAYSMFGSEYQSLTSYTEFRQSFQSLLGLNTKEKSILEKKNGIVQIKVDLEVTVRDESYQEVQEDWHYTIVIGYENDQLKILKMSRST